MGSRKIIGPFKQVLTLDHLPFKGTVRDEDLEIIEEGGILCEKGIILEVGRWSELVSKYSMTNVEVEEIENPEVLIPGFVDSHTHICWAGNRARDYALRLQGKSYLEIAESGGGIWDTVRKTREAEIHDLVESTLERIGVHKRNGITTVEIKSGYGLNRQNEIKILQAIQKAAEQTNIDIVPTCLAAHIPDKEYSGSTQENLEYILNDVLPEVKASNLAERVDIFIEKGAFSNEESNQYLQKAIQLGFKTTAHVDQFTAGSSQIAVKNNSLSADHLEASSEKEINILANSNTVATVLPGASLGLGIDFAPARRLLDAGACLSIASDWNPGSAPNGDLLMQAALLGAYERLTSAEVLAGLTYRAAKALDLEDRGRIRKGLIADFISFPTKDYRDILYHQGAMKPGKILKRGEQV